ncbi:MAG: hypothetical protein QOJ10_1459 [Chloroflexota bacterium]|nr:hypothetical protein [Chloroflexota bacterium]
MIRQTESVDGLDNKLGVAVAALIGVTGAIYAAQPPRIVAALVSGWVLVALFQAIRGFKYDRGYADGVNAKFLDERMHFQPIEIKQRSLAVLKVIETRNQERLLRKGRLLTQVTATLGLVAGVGLLGKMLGVS